MGYQVIRKAVIKNNTHFIINSVNEGGVATHPFSLDELFTQNCFM